MRPLYKIISARQQDFRLLPEIEQAAGMMYSETPYSELAHGPNVSGDVDMDHDYVWVVTEDEEPVGFVIARELADSVHIHEIDVHPRCARRGLGRQLIEHVATWARAKSVNKLTLTTFSDVQWNGPYYSRLGFETVSVDALNADLREILRAEAVSGFPMQHRIAMQIIL